VNDGFGSFTFVFTLAVSDSFLLAGTTRGVGRRPLSELVTNIEDFAETIPTEFYLEQNFPNLLIHLQQSHLTFRKNHL